MHGLLHRAVRNLVRRHRGVGGWELVHERTCACFARLDPADETSLLLEQQYDDGQSEELLAQAFALMGVGVEEGLRLLGAETVRMALRMGYARLIRGFASDSLESLLRNVNEMHTALERSLTHATLPSFAIDDVESGTGSFVLVYSSPRGGLASIVEGALPAVAEGVLRERISMERLAVGTRECRWRVTVVEPLAPPPPAEPVAEGEPAERASCVHMHDAVVSLSALGALGALGALDPRARTHGARARVHTCPAQLTTPAHADDGQRGSFGRRVRHGQASRLSSRSSSPEHGACEADALPRDGDHVDTPEWRCKRALLLERMSSIEAATDAWIHVAAEMRVVRPGLVSADWSQPKQLGRVSAFWRESAGCFDHFARSELRDVRDRLQRVVFCSHVWPEPGDWADARTPFSYAEAKTMELAFAVREYALAAGVEPGRVWLWVDKTCIPQQHALLPAFLRRIGDFIRMSDAMVVVMPWTYFTRLWCCFEWAHFLSSHPPSALHVCTKLMLNDATLHLYLAAVRGFSVGAAECTDEADRLKLERLIQENFESCSAFEHFVRASAIAVLARASVVQGMRAGGGAGGGGRHYFDEWVALAHELGMSELAAALERADVAAWRAQSCAQAHYLDMSQVDIATRRVSNHAAAAVAAAAAAAAEAAGTARPDEAQRRRSSSGGGSASDGGSASADPPAWRDEAYLWLADRWFEEQVEPVLLRERRRLPPRAPSEPDPRRPAPFAHSLGARSEEDAACSMSDAATDFANTPPRPLRFGEDLGEGDGSPPLPTRLRAPFRKPPREADEEGRSSRAAAAADDSLPARGGEEGSAASAAVARAHGAWATGRGMRSLQLRARQQRHSIGGGGIAAERTPESPPVPRRFQLLARTVLRRAAASIALS